MTVQPPPATAQAIRQVVASHPEVEAAILYGSCALGRHRPASDIDLTAYNAIHHHALLDHIQRAGVALYRRSSGSD